VARLASARAARSNATVADTMDGRVPSPNAAMTSAPIVTLDEHKKESAARKG
jgi:hypothetical protein